MKLLFFVVLLLALEGCQGSGRFEATQIGPFAISNAELIGLLKELEPSPAVPIEQ